MMDDERERRLADEFAGLLDGATVDLAGRTRELQPELDALAEIDRTLDPAAPLPDRLSGHKILGEIGAGGMGRVMLALDEALGRKVAVKTLSARYSGDSELRARFMEEARAMARLNHPHVARIYSLGPAVEPPHFVMEYLTGAPLTTAAARLDFREKAELLARIARAAHFLHQQGIIHRDLKPANILVDADGQPKLLDFGLALDLSREEHRAALTGIAGTPEYLSPEQASGSPLDARSDVFALGAILYELLTGAPPFRAATITQLLRAIREDEPVLPRRLAPGVPRDLQNICLKALEKDPAGRYASAEEMAGDLHRFVAGETVLAEPAAYARLIAGKVGQHLRDLESWRHDQIVSDAEYEGIRKRYERLIEREDAWIMEARRLTLPQVTLYLGAWILAVGAAFLTLFPFPALHGAPAIGAAWAAAFATAWVGARNWKSGNARVAIGFLLACCLVAPIAALATAQEAGLFTALTQGQARLELFHRLEFSKQATNAQLWWALLAALPVCWWLRRFTRAPVFSLMFAAYAAQLCIATLLRMGMLDWLDHDPGRFYFRLIPCALLFLVAGYLFERRRFPDDSRYFYPFAVAFTWVSLSGVAAFHEPYAHWLQAAAPWTHGRVEYLFMLNGAIYFTLDRLCRLQSAPQLRLVGHAFRFAIPGHAMTSLLLLGIDAKSPAEQRIFAWLLPAVACVFVFAGIPRQMKNFFASGLLFLAIGLYRLQQQIFPQRAQFPLLLLAAGLLLMLAAGNYSPLKVAVARGLKKIRLP
jgi:hypothetical protein